MIGAVGAVLAIVAIWIDAVPGSSYWDFDGTIAGFGLALGIIAALLAAAGHTGRAMGGALFAVGAVLLGYWGWFPAVTAFDDWDQDRKSTRLNSSHVKISYAVFCLKKKKKIRDGEVKVIGIVYRYEMCK